MVSVPIGRTRCIEKAPLGAPPVKVMANPAETYERDMVPALFRPWAPLLVDLAAPEPDDRALDVACGTGVVARALAARILGPGRVAAIDLNPAMVEVARRAAAEEGLAIEWHQGQMERMSFADGEFDVVTCQQGLQFSEDRPCACAEFRRVLRLGGRLALATWRELELHPFWSTFNDALVRHIGIPAMAAPFSLGGDELQRLLEEAGFREVTIRPHSLTHVFPGPDRFVAMEVDVIAAAIPATQHLDDKARAELVAAISADMAGPLQEASRDGRVTTPMHGNLTLAIR